MMWFGSEEQAVSGTDSNLSLPMLLKLHVPEHVGTNFKKFGILLLNDLKGAQVDIIETELRGNVEDIITKILQYWFQGKGRSVTWEILLDTLRACNLNEFADQIQQTQMNL
jgi:hypothetical protein